MSVAIGLGLTEFPFAGARGYWRWADLCESGGIDSIWQTDRIVTAAPMLECMSAMAALAGRTRRLKFGMNVVSLAMREPVLVARQCASIDVLSEGRLLPGFGVGNPQAPEWSALHIDTATRGRRTDEALEIIARLWAGGPVDFEGTCFRLSGARIAPLPVQPALPMWLGGRSMAAIRRTARFGTGWQGGPETPQRIEPVIAAIRVAVRETGRRIDDDHYGATFPFRFGRADSARVRAVMTAWQKRTGDDPRDYFAIGDGGAIIDRMDAYVRAGVSKFILRPLADTEDDTLEQTRRLIEEVLPLVASRWPRRA
jgi:probable F420-dependent oxidoreductase